MIVGLFDGDNVSLSLDGVKLGEKVGCLIVGWGIVGWLVLEIDGNSFIRSSTVGC